MAPRRDLLFGRARCAPCPPAPARDSRRGRAHRRGGRYGVGSADIGPSGVSKRSCRLCSFGQARVNESGSIRGRRGEGSFRQEKSHAKKSNQGSWGHIDVLLSVAVRVFGGERRVLNATSQRLGAFCQEKSHAKKSSQGCVGHIHVLQSLAGRFGLLQLAMNRWKGDFLWDLGRPNRRPRARACPVIARSCPSRLRRIPLPPVHPLPRRPSTPPSSRPAPARPPLKSARALPAAERSRLAAALLRGTARGLRAPTPPPASARKRSLEDVAARRPAPERPPRIFRGPISGAGKTPADLRQGRASRRRPAHRWRGESQRRSPPPTAADRAWPAPEPPRVRSAGPRQAVFSREPRSSPAERPAGAAPEAPRRKGVDVGESASPRNTSGSAGSRRI